MTSSSACISDASPCCFSSPWSAHSTTRPFFWRCDRRARRGFWGSLGPAQDSISVSASLMSLMEPRLSLLLLTAGFTSGAGSASSVPRPHNLTRPRLQAASRSRLRPTRSRETNCKADADAGRMNAGGSEGGNFGGGNVGGGGSGGGAGSGNGDGWGEGSGIGGCGGGNGGEGFGNDGKGGSSAWRKALWAAHAGSGKSTSLARAFQRSALLGCSSAKRLSSSSSMHRKGLERARQRGERGRGGGDAGRTRARAVRPRSGTASLTGPWAAWERVQDSSRMLREGGTVHMVSAISVT